MTTKLTATPQPSSTTGPGWSRPSSAAPPVAAGTTSTPNGISALPSSLPQIPTAPQLPQAGKVIQPQPRSVTVGGSQRDSAGSSSKPVWGNLRATATTPQRPDLKVQNDFPTAAEVAQGTHLYPGYKLHLAYHIAVATSVRQAKIHDSIEAAETAAANKQARLEEADTFRGVHLDPNAHHWDEVCTSK